MAPKIYTIGITVVISPASPNKNLRSLARLEAPGPPTHLQAPQGSRRSKSLVCDPDSARDTMSHSGPQRQTTACLGRLTEPQTPKSSLEQPPAPESDGSPWSCSSQTARPAKGATSYPHRSVLGEGRSGSACHQNPLPTSQSFLQNAPGSLTPGSPQVQ